MSNKYSWLIIGCFTAAAVGGFLVYARFVGVGNGYPLDDAWIHQTYARNLARWGEWAFSPDTPSAGSTAPLWSAWLALGYFLGSGAFTWTILSGWLSLWGLSLVSQRLLSQLTAHKPTLLLAAAVGVGLEWHLVWAALSGMETILYALLVTLTITLLVSRQSQGWLIGVLVGVAVWTRPDGITLLGPALLIFWLRRSSWGEFARQGGQLLASFGVVFLLYLGFNQVTAGALWPTTFYAKQAEYALLREIPLLQRIGEQLRLPLVGMGIVLLPGFIRLVWNWIKERKWVELCAVAWVAGYFTLYALRLPVTYQHGRYVIPAMPLYFTLGAAGMIDWLGLNATVAWRRVSSRVWVLLTSVTLGMFYVLGARAYAADVRFINTEMVAVSQWVGEHTNPNAIIAAHDIGAMGYFGDRRIIDLAGLVSPEVIAFIRDEGRLGQYLESQAADYLVTFPGWYPQLTLNLPVVYFNSDGSGPAYGGEHMVLYLWELAR